MADDPNDLLIEMGVALTKLNRQLARAESDFRRTAIRQEEAFKKANNRIAKDFERLQQEANRSLSKITVPGLSFGAFGAGLLGALSTREIMQYADAWTVAGNKIAAASQISGRQARSLSAINDIATETRSGLTETADLYAKLMLATAGVAQSEEEVARATETVNKAFKAGGAAAHEQTAGILQLGQALGSGVLQGDELRSLRENAPLLAQAIADEFGVTVGKLKDLGAEGQLTADRVFRAILNGQSKIEAAFGTTNATISDGFTRLKNAVTEYVGAADNSIGASQKLAGALGYLADNLDLVVAAGGVLGARVLGPALVAMLTGLVGVLRGAAAGLLGVATGATTATVALGGLRTVLGLLGGPVGIVLAGLAAMPALTTSTAERTESLRTAGEGAATALDAFAAASKRAKDEQAGMAGEVSRATEAILAQNRAVLQAEREKLEQQVRETRDAFSGRIFSSDLEEAITTLAPAERPGQNFNRYLAAIGPQLRAIKEGRGDVAAVVREMDRLAGAGQEVSDVLAEIDRRIAAGETGTALDEATQELVRQADAIGGFEKELEALRRAPVGTTQAVDAFRALMRAMQEAAQAGEVMRRSLFDNEEGLRQQLGTLSSAEAALEAVKAALRGNFEEAQRLMQMANPFGPIQEGAESAKTTVLSLKDAMEALPKEIKATISGLEGVSSGVEAATKLLRQFEGFRSTPYDDGKRDSAGKRVGPPVWRAGWGSDTITLADGTIRQITQGMRVSQEDANRDLERRLSTEFLPAARNAVGAQNFDALTPAQQGVLGSLSYNYGAGAWSGALKPVADAVRAGSAEGVAEAIAALAGHNGGINGERRLAEGSTFANGVGFQGALARGEEAERAVAEASKDAARTAKEANDEREREAKLRTDLVERAQQQVADAQFELTLIGKTAAEQARLRAAYLLTNEARAAGIDLNERLAGSEKTYGQVIAEQAAQIGEYVAQQDRRAKAVQSAAEREQFMAQVQTDLKNGLLDAIVAGESFADVLANVAQMLARAALQAALFNEGPFSGGAGGGLLGGLFKTGFGSLFGGFRATGGSVSPNKVYMVGERGPELFAPPSMGSIIPNNKLNAGGPMSINITVAGARGNAEIEEMVASGVHQGLSAYDKAMPARVQGINARPRRR